MADRDEVSERAQRDARRWTIPNVICVGRILGSFVLVGIALRGEATAFTALFVILSLSDWVDGKLAIWLNQRSSFGARLDSFADFTLYGALLIGFLCLKFDVILSEWPWVAVALFSYVVTCAAGYWKFGKIPSYHTRGAKLSQWIVLLGALSAVMEWSNWPFRLAALAVTLTNIEATAITYVLPQWRADVLSLRRAYRLRDDEMR